MSEPDDTHSDREDPPEPRPRTDHLGDLLPDQTRDESATGWGDEDAGDSDEHLRREVPPHHG